MIALMKALYFLLRMIPFIPELSPGMAGVVINVPKWSLTEVQSRGIIHRAV